MGVGTSCRGCGDTQKYLFLSSNKVQFVPSWCAVWYYFPPPSLPSVSLSLTPAAPEFPLPSPAGVAVLKPGLRPPCGPGQPGGWAFPLSPKEQNASLSLCLSVPLCVRVCLPHPVSPLHVYLLPVAAPPAHPESRSLAVLAPLQDVDVGAGEMALFECLVAGPADVEVDWLCRGRLLQPALLKCKMHFDGRKCKLLLTSVHEDDSGVYTCKLSTAKGNCPLGPQGCLGPQELEGGARRGRSWVQNEMDFIFWGKNDGWERVPYTHLSKRAWSST